MAIFNRRCAFGACWHLGILGSWVDIAVDIDGNLLNMVERGFRAYDPCFACATHSLPGQAPLKVEVYDHERRLMRLIERNLD